MDNKANMKDLERCITLILSVSNSVNRPRCVEVDIFTPLNYRLYVHQNSVDLRLY